MLVTVILLTLTALGFTRVSVLGSEKVYLLVQLDELKKELDQKNTVLMEALCDNSRLKLSLDERNVELKSICDIKNDMMLQFKDISTGIIEAQRENFSREQRKDLTNILDPFKRQMSDFDVKIQRTIQENNETITKNEAALREHIDLLVKHTETIGTKADSLASVLRNDKKIQGNWGELQLKNLLESVGLTNGVDYLEQQSVRNQGGEQFFLDFVVNVPGHRKLILDSKVSLVNYENYRLAKDGFERDEFMRRYCGDIKKHIEELRKKEYHKLYGVSSLDFVFMFLPLENAYLEAIGHDRDLTAMAFRNNVAIVTGSSLVPVLRMVENLWSTEKQTKNIETIVGLAMRIYDKLLKFTDSMEAIKNNIDGAQKSYEKALAYLSHGKGNVLKTANDIRILSGREKTTKNIVTDYEDIDYDSDPALVQETHESELF
ncbi:MAG: DNA recombination protein RmuC [Rickettsiales bacterium]|jgi:DNA recombination protein RmuC|nr:DNA recombination protein RmuC [Rickettsiales bacterium]